MFIAIIVIVVIVVIRYLFHPLFKLTWGIAKKLVTFAFKAALIGIVLFLVISQLVALS